MGEVRIYKLDLSAGDFSYSGSNWSSTWGGSDAPVTGYPEFGQVENVKRSEGVGASGQDVVDAVNTSTYAFSWINFCGVGNLIYGQFDCRGGGLGLTPPQPLKIRWKQFLKTSAFAENDYSAPLFIAVGGVGGAEDPLFNQHVCFGLEMFGDPSSPDFQWHVTYLTVNGPSTAFAEGELNVSLTGNPGTVDDSEHEMIVTIVPSTITGSFNNSVPVLPTPGSATVGSDGSIDVTMDGVSVISGTGLKFVINKYGITAPAVYYAKAVWHGD